MRTHLLAVALLGLAACGQNPPPAEEAPAVSAEEGAITYDALRNRPDWIFILRTSDGGEIHFNQRSVTRADGMADIWLQVRHGREQVTSSETETTETVIRYTVERMHYRFNCADDTFTIAERQIMGANETVVAREELAEDWRAAETGGAAIYVLPIACRGT